MIEVSDWMTLENDILTIQPAVVNVGDHEVDFIAYYLDTLDSKITNPMNELLKISVTQPELSNDDPLPTWIENYFGLDVNPGSD